jgi:hypothetical protein
MKGGNIRADILDCLVVMSRYLLAVSSAEGDGPVIPIERAVHADDLVPSAECADLDYTAELVTPHDDE